MFKHLIELFEADKIFFPLFRSLLHLSRSGNGVLIYSPFQQKQLKIRNLRGNFFKRKLALVLFSMKRRNRTHARTNIAIGYNRHNPWLLEEILAQSSSSIFPETNCALVSRLCQQKGERESNVRVEQNGGGNLCM